MRLENPLIAFVAGVLCFAGSPIEAQWLDYRVAGVPRTADGKVNLSAPTPKSSR